MIIQRMTIQRRVILEELRKSKEHPTADQLYQQVRRRLPRISLGTVYRNLDILSKSGLINKLEGACAQTRYDADTDKHEHIRCLQCGSIADVAADAGPELKSRIGELTGYEVTGYNLEFLGICPDCIGLET